MSTEDVITQRRFGRKTSFRFGNDKLAFSLSDPTGEVNGSALYQSIDTENYSTLRVNVGRSYYWLALVISLFFSAAILNSREVPARYSYVLPVALVCCIIVASQRQIISVSFTILTVAGNSGGPVRIIHDKYHDIVLDRIRSKKIELSEVECGNRPTNSASA